MNESAARVLRRVRLREGIRDVAVRHGRITEIAERTDPRGADLVDGDGGALLPGLHDHHLHLHATAAAPRPIWSCSTARSATPSPPPRRKRCAAR